LTLGHKDNAIRELRSVMTAEPRDRLAKALLDALTDKLPDINAPPSDVAPPPRDVTPQP